MPSRRSLQTILFTDIVDSTKRAVELGDRLWSNVLAEYRELVRSEIGRFGGSEANLSGDGILATFERPAAALRCAWSIHERIRELGLELRSGLHAGEVEGKGQELSGIAVHTAVRIADAAEPGEIVASGTVRELVAGTGFGFAARGSRALEGVPGEKAIFALEKLPPGSISFRTTRWIPELTVAQTKKGLAAAAVVLLVLFGLAGLWVVVQDRGESFAPGEAVAEAGPGLAVLPFGVNSPELDEWSEGMVDVLGINLDGVAGLRAIDSRTVLARWSEVVGEEGEVDLVESLEVARRTGARYALVGDVVGLGSDLRISGEVYDVESGQRLGRSSVEGGRDEVFDLVDRFSMEIVRAVVGGDAEELPGVDLARATTDSLTALKSYLEGEILFRAGEFEPAVESYRRAVERDSTFALAWIRLANSLGWTGDYELERQAVDHALGQIERLPAREATMVRYMQGFQLGAAWAVDTLEQAVRRYPDDAMMWYGLGEAYWHFGKRSFAGPADAERAFARAVEIDPLFGPAYIHRVNLAFVEADSARAAGILDTLAMLAESGSEDVAASRIAFRIAFGDPTTAERARARLDSIVPHLLDLPHWHPRLLERQEPILRARLEEEEIGGAYDLASNLFQRGRVEEALELLARPATPPIERRVALVHFFHHRVPLPDSLLEQAFGSAGEIDTTDAAEWFAEGAWAGRAGDARRLRRAIDGLETLAETGLAEGDTIGYRFHTNTARALEGHAAWHRGDPERALEILEEVRLLGRSPISTVLVGPAIRWWHAEILDETGRLREAARYYETHWNDVYALERLGHIYEELGEIEKARGAYGKVLDAWKDSDPFLRERWEHARRYVAETEPMKRR